jgi:hypothetical protein
MAKENYTITLISPYVIDILHKWGYGFRGKGMDSKYYPLAITSLPYLLISPHRLSIYLYII